MADHLLRTPVKKAISDDFYDDLVVLCFHVLPAMDSRS